VISNETDKGFKGKRVVAFESRMADQMRTLIARFGGDPLVAPSMREIPLEKNSDIVEFGERLHSGQLDFIILLTGVGTRTMLKVLDVCWARNQTVNALGQTALVTRGPKPVQVLREIGLQPTVNVPEPNTWRDILSALDGQRLEGKRVAVQEYGVSNAQLLQGLRDRGAVVDAVTVYRWALPDDLNPLMQAIHESINHTVDVVLFTSAVQVEHLLQVAEWDDRAGEVKRACERMMVGSIGPVASERIRVHNLPVDFEPTHAKMGVLVKEASERADEILLAKRSKLAM
jgi:uroporphyrinogen-III synthase